MDWRCQAGNAMVGPSTAQHPSLPLRQLQLDAAVALVGVFGVAGVERLKFGKAGGDQPLRRHAARNQVLHHRDRARRGQLPVRLESGLLIGRTSVWPSTRSTQAISARDLLVELDQRARRPCRVRRCPRAAASPVRCRRTLRTGTRSGRRRCGCPAGCRGWRAGGRRIRSGSATIPAPAAPARRSGAGRDRRSGSAIPCRASRRRRALLRARRAGGAAR